MWLHQQQASCDKSLQAFPLLFVLQVTKAGSEGLGTKLPESKAKPHQCITWEQG